jgi:hypothetical protein
MAGVGKVVREWECVTIQREGREKKKKKKEN